MKLNFDLEDLTNAALKRLVKQLLVAGDAEEKKIMAKLAKNPKNELADLDEEMHGKPSTPMVEDDDPFELEVSGESDDSDTDMQPKKKGKK